MVECDWALLCDYAFMDAAGKMCLIGIFDNFNVRKVPAIHPRAALVVKLRGLPAEAWHARVEIVRPGGSQLQKVEISGIVSEHGGAGVAVDLQPIQLPDLGPYGINIYVNDQISYQTGFSVVVPQVHAPS